MPDGFFRNTFVLTVLFTLLSVLPAYADKPVKLFLGLPQAVLPGDHGINAHQANVDIQGPLQGNKQIQLLLPDGGTIILQRDGFQKRGPDSAVWRGSVVGNDDSRAVLTIREGVLYGRVRVGADIYELRPALIDLSGGNQKGEITTGEHQVIEKLDPEAFPDDENDVLVPLDYEFENDIESVLQLPEITASADNEEIIIDLLSMYTAQARDAAGGVANIEAQIQAAVDVANAAFIDSNMKARYRLVQAALASHSDSANMSVDIDWVMNDTGVADLRNRYGADLVSLLVKNGGSYCGLGYVQRSPGLGFAPYAFQVTDMDCAVGNLSFAHEHGHNIGMEHNPENSGVSSGSASYPWSFGHFVNGDYRTVMSYSNQCNFGCSRVGLFSNPDISFLGSASGVPGERDNAQTGDFTAAIVASFRATVITEPNNPPVFNVDPITAASVEQGQAATGSLAGTASDADGDPLSYAKASGPAWLTIASGGGLSGTPQASDVGLNVFSVQVSDANGGTDTATLNIEVSAQSGGSSGWVELSYDDFESGWGSFTDGGRDASLYTGAVHAHQGNDAANIQDNGGISSSFYYTNGIDIDSPGYTQVKIEFWFKAVSFDNSSEDFWVQFYDGSSWQTVAAFVQGSDFQNDQFYSRTVIIDEANFAFSDNMKIRFMSDASGNSDDIYIDEIRVSASGSGTTANNPPVFNQDPISLPALETGQAVSGSLAGSASDADGDPLNYAKASGPAWLTIAFGGGLSGTPQPSDVGLNVFSVQVSDANGDTDTSTLNIEVSAQSGGGSGWVELSYDDFESGWGNYTDGGRDAARYSGAVHAHQGNYSANIQDNSGIDSSFYYTDGIDIDSPGYTQIKIEFWFKAVSFDSNSEDFWVQFYDGSTWQTVAAFAQGIDFQNDQFFSKTVIIDESNFTFPNAMKIRFMSDASGDRDDIYIDEIRVSAQ